MVGANFTCYHPQPLNLSTLCNPACQEQLFYSAAVLVENKTQLNLSLQSLSSHDSFVIDDLKFIPNSGCSPVVGSTTLPLPTCPNFTPTSSKSISHTDSVQKLTTSSFSIPTSSSSPGQTGFGNTDFLITMLALVVVLLATFVLLILVFILIMCFINKRKTDHQDFPYGG